LLGSKGITHLTLLHSPSSHSKESPTVTIIIIITTTNYSRKLALRGLLFPNFSGTDVIGNWNRDTGLCGEEATLYCAGTDPADPCPKAEP
jgi:hypothetical protein